MYATSWSRTENICLRGRGPTLLQTKKKRKRAEEIFIQQCKDNITQGNIEQDIPNDHEEIFIPIKRARHKVLKTFSSSNPTQKKQSKPNVQKTKNNTSQQSPKKNTNQGTKKSVQKPKKQNANSEDEDSDIEQMSRVPHCKERARLDVNPLEIVFINGNIIKCSGCEFKYNDNERREPFYLVFKIHMHCMRPL